MLYSKENASRTPAPPAAYFPIPSAIPPVLISTYPQAYYHYPYFYPYQYPYPFPYPYPHHCYPKYWGLASLFHRCGRNTKLIYSNIPEGCE